MYLSASALKCNMLWQLQPRHWILNGSRSIQRLRRSGVIVRSAVEMSTLFCTTLVLLSMNGLLLYFVDHTSIVLSNESHGTCWTSSVSPNDHAKSILYGYMMASPPIVMPPLPVHTLLIALRCSSGTRPRLIACLLLPAVALLVCPVLAV